MSKKNDLIDILRSKDNEEKIYESDFKSIEGLLHVISWIMAIPSILLITAVFLFFLLENILFLHIEFSFPAILQNVGKYLLGTFGLIIIVDILLTKTLGGWKIILIFYSILLFGSMIILLTMV